ncbi:MAG: hypothetical protein ACRBN8_46360 [Nannocystales bacterium]
MFESLDLVLDYVGGSVVAAGLVVAGVWVGRKLFERGLDSAIQQGIDGHRNDLAKKLEDHKADIADRLTAQQREHERSLAALRSELRGVEREAEQLRAHSLGLEAERRRNFEARRAELCAELAAEANELFHLLTMGAISVEAAEEDLPPREAQQVMERVRSDCARVVADVYKSARVASLYLSRDLYKVLLKACGVFSKTSEAISEFVGAPPGSDERMMALGQVATTSDDAHRTIGRLLVALRGELLSPVQTGLTSPGSGQRSPDASDDVEGETLPTGETPHSQPGTSPTTEAVEPG